MEICLEYGEVLLRLLISAFCGLIFGLERYHKGKPVGARTNILVALAACETAMISAYGFVSSSEVYQAADIAIKTDPARLVVGILSGIGFIGAGIIYKSPAGTIKGITTATEIYAIAVISIGYGLGLYFLSTCVAIIAYFAMQSSRINKIANFLHKNKRPDDDTEDEEEG
ncbi:MAG: MgtC/SapB family protein [Synergistaceae bacterium]